VKTKLFLAINQLIRTINVCHGNAILKNGIDSQNPIANKSK
jgi:hypothetical protein